MRSGLAKQTRLESLGVALKLDSDKLRSFNYREKLSIASDPSSGTQMLLMVCAIAI